MKLRLHKLTSHPRPARPRAAEEDGDDEFEAESRPELPDAVEERLLLSQDFC